MRNTASFQIWRAYISQSLMLWAYFLQLHCRALEYNSSNVKNGFHVYMQANSRETRAIAWQSGDPNSWFPTLQQYKKPFPPSSISTIEHTQSLPCNNTNLTYNSSIFSKSYWIRKGIRSFWLRIKALGRILISTIKKIEYETSDIALTSRMKEMASLSVIKSNGNLRWLQEETRIWDSGQCVDKTLLWQKNPERWPPIPSRCGKISKSSSERSEK